MSQSSCLSPFLLQELKDSFLHCPALREGGCRHPEEPLSLAPAQRDSALPSSPPDPDILRIHILTSGSPRLGRSRDSLWGEAEQQQGHRDQGVTRSGFTAAWSLAQPLPPGHPGALGSQPRTHQQWHEQYKWHC